MGNNTNSSYERYKLLIATQNFHYDGFIKWVRFFYVAIGVSFMGYLILVVTENSINYAFDKAIVTVVGYIISMACYLAIKGYFYSHTKIIDLIIAHENKESKESKESKEGENNKKIYHYILNGRDEGCSNYCVLWKKANISIFKIMQTLTFIVTIAWGILFLKSLGCSTDCSGLTLMFGISITVSFLFAFIARKLKVDLKRDVEA